MFAPKSQISPQTKGDSHILSSSKFEFRSINICLCSDRKTHSGHPLENKVSNKGFSFKKLSKIYCNIFAAKPSVSHFFPRQKRSFDL